jgi:hypothetical protein
LDPAYKLVAVSREPTPAQCQPDEEGTEKRNEECSGEAHLALRKGRDIVALER